MKNINLLYSALATLILVGSCKQEDVKLTPPTVVPPVVVTPSKGSADFTKFVAIGNSLTAGYQAGALFDEGQANSLPKILSTQFSLAQGTTLAFNQPDINSVYGYYGVAGDKVLGRLILFDADGPAGPKTAAPAPVGSTGMPSPYSTGGTLPAAFAGDKTKLNNFAVPGILLGQALIPDTGNPASPYFNPLWARFASAPGVKSILEDALAASPSFFLFDLGNNDVLGYATGGASNPAIFTSETNFQSQYTTAINTLLASNANLKGVVATIPDVVTIPFFSLVAWNAIPLDAATSTAVNGGFVGYNGVIEAIKGNPGLLTAFGLTPEGLTARKISFSATSKNPILITDETLTDLGGAFDALQGAGAITAQQRAALEPYRRVRQTKSTDLITLTAGSVLGTTVGGNPQLVNGVSVPLEDKYVLLPSEVAEIKARTDAFNTIIKAAADGSSNRVALADLNAAFTSLVTNKAGIYDGITITPSLPPPTGAFSEDGVHPNSRGYAFMANIFIDAINAKFGAVIPKANIATYKVNGLPVNP
ncbi:MAG: hypothetical protein HOP30_18155 [Cyclobacteriaceae bacterium]|nr:hypothetical protein [Cyclobacteriaceae bacterium]